MLLRADSLAATGDIAAVLARFLRAGDVIVLAGGMGAGKTTFAQGVGRALGVTEPITSPTFTLVHSHPVPGGRLTLHHADLYRLDRTTELRHLALDELAEFDGVVLVEWGDVAAAALGDHLTVRLRRDEGDDDGDDDGARDDGARDDDADDDDDDDDDDGDGDDGDGDGEDDVIDFGLDESRLIELTAAGPAWATRWERIVDAMEEYRC